MAATAKLSRNYAVRMAIMIVAFTGFAGWCLYDGMVKYPRVNRLIEQQEIRDRLASEQQAVGGVERVSAAAGTPDRVDPSKRKSKWDIWTQYFMAAACAVFALTALSRLLWAVPRTLAADENGLKAVEGTLIPYGAMFRLDKRKWNRKGIADITYELDGRQGKTRIDDWIFKGGEDVLAEVERHATFRERIGDKRTGADAPPATAETVPDDDGAEAPSPRTEA